MGAWIYASGNRGSRYNIIDTLRIRHNGGCAGMQMHIEAQAGRRLWLKIEPPIAANQMRRDLNNVSDK